MAGRTDLTPDQLSYFGVIQGAARQHETTADIWEAVRAEAERRGKALPDGMFAAVNQLRSMGSSLAYAAERVRTAADNEAILSSHLGILPYGHDPASTGGQRAFDVRVNYLYLADNVTREDYVTLRYTGGLPATIGELRADVTDVTGELVSGYNRDFVGVGDIEIGEL